VSYLPNLRVLAREIGVRPFAPLIDLRGWFGRFVLCAVACAGIAAAPLGDGLASLLTRTAAAAIVYGVVMGPFAISGTLGPYARRFIPRPLQVWTTRYDRADAA